jgi:hypothetical protein
VSAAGTASRAGIAGTASTGAEEEAGDEATPAMTTVPAMPAVSAASSIGSSREVLPSTLSLSHGGTAGCSSKNGRRKRDKVSTLVNSALDVRLTRSWRGGSSTVEKTSCEHLLKYPYGYGWEGNSCAPDCFFSDMLHMYIELPNDEEKTRFIDEFPITGFQEEVQYLCHLQDTRLFTSAILDAKRKEEQLYSKVFSGRKHGVSLEEQSTPFPYGYDADYEDILTEVLEKSRAPYTLIRTKFYYECQESCCTQRGEEKKSIRIYFCRFEGKLLCYFVLGKSVEKELQLTTEERSNSTLLTTAYSAYRKL